MRGSSLAAFIACTCFAALAAPDAFADKPKPDPRLEQKVTVDAVAAPLSEVVAELSQKTGVSLDLHQNLKNQKVTVLVDDQPLYLVMNSLRDLLDGLWFTETVKGQTGYYLQQKAGWQFEAARLRAAAKAKQEQAEADFRAQVREIARAGALPRDQLLALLDTNPQLVLDVANCGSYAPALLGQLSQAQLDKILSAPLDTPPELLAVPYAEMPAAGQALVEKVMHAFSDEPERFGKALSDPGTVNLYIMRRGKPPYKPVLYVSLGSDFTGQMLGEVPRADDEGVMGLSDVAAVLGLTQTALQDRLEATEAGRAALAAREEAARRWTHQWDPLIARQKRLKEGPTVTLELNDAVFLETTLNALHEKTGVQVIADSYVTKQGVAALKLPKATDEMVEWIADGFDRAWARDGTIYRLRSKTWYEDERIEPPVWLIKRMAPKVDSEKRRFESNLTDFVDAATHLTDEQIAILDGRDNDNPCYVGVQWLADRLRGRSALSLRFYASLDALQQEQVRGSGLSIEEMSPSQQTAFAACLNEVFRTDLPPHYLAHASLCLNVASKVEEHGAGRKWQSTNATFTFTLAGGRQETAFAQLAYVPPESEWRKSKRELPHPPVVTRDLSPSPP
jgi:hypothetical protein